MCSLNCWLRLFISFQLKCYKCHKNTELCIACISNDTLDKTLQKSLQDVCGFGECTRRRTRHSGAPDVMSSIYLPYCWPQFSSETFSNTSRSPWDSDRVNGAHYCVLVSWVGRQRSRVYCTPGLSEVRLLRGLVWASSVFPPPLSRDHLHPFFINLCECRYEKSAQGQALDNFFWLT